MTPLIKPRPKPMGRIPRTPYTQELKDYAFQLIAEGHSYTAIGTICGVHKDAVKRWCVEAGIVKPEKPSKYNDAIRRRAIALVEQGHSYALVEEMLHIHRELIKRWCERQGVRSKWADNNRPTVAGPPVGEPRVPPILVSGAHYRIVTKAGRVYEKARYHQGTFRIVSSWNDVVLSLKDVELVADHRVFSQVKRAGQPASARRNYFYPIEEATFGFKVGEEPDPDRLPPTTWVNPIRRRLLDAQQRRAGK